MADKKDIIDTVLDKKRKYWQEGDDSRRQNARKVLKKDEKDR
jgi:hypothetical protein